MCIIVRASAPGFIPSPHSGLNLAECRVTQDLCSVHVITITATYSDRNELSSSDRGPCHPETLYTVRGGSVYWARTEVVLVGDVALAAGTFLELNNVPSRMYLQKYVEQTKHGGGKRRFHEKTSCLLMHGWSAVFCMSRSDESPCAQTGTRARCDTSRPQGYGLYGREGSGKIRRHHAS